MVLIKPPHESIRWRLHFLWQLSTVIDRIRPPLQIIQDYLDPTPLKITNFIGKIIETLSYKNERRYKQFGTDCFSG